MKLCESVLRPRKAHPALRLVGVCVHRIIRTSQRNDFSNSDSQIRERFIALIHLHKLNYERTVSVVHAGYIMECKTITRPRGRNLIIHPMSRALCLSMGALSTSRMTKMSTDNFTPSGVGGRSLLSATVTAHYPLRLHSYAAE